jgi:hypothetical protein
MYANVRIFGRSKNGIYLKGTAYIQKIDCWEKFCVNINNSQNFNT